MTPIVLPALALAAGMVALHWQASLPPLAWGWTILALMLLLLLPGKGGRAALWRLPAVFLLGFVWAGWRAELRLAERLDPALEGVIL